MDFLKHSFEFVRIHKANQTGETFNYSDVLSESDAKDFIMAATLLDYAVMDKACCEFAGSELAAGAFWKLYPDKELLVLATGYEFEMLDKVLLFLDPIGNFWKEDIDLLLIHPILLTAKENYRRIQPEYIVIKKDHVEAYMDQMKNAKSIEISKPLSAAEKEERYWNAQFKKPEEKKPPKLEWSFVPHSNEVFQTPSFSSLYMEIDDHREYRVNADRVDRLFEQS